MTALCWLLAGGFAALSPVWILAGLAWELDLLANLNAQWLTLSAACAALCLILRRRAPLALSLAACALLALPLLLHRAAFWPRQAPVPRQTSPSNDPRQSVRVLHYNARSAGTIAQHVELMTRTDADVISLLGPGAQEQFSVIYGNGLEDVFPGKLVRPWKPTPDGSSTYISAAYLVSRWPITPIDFADLGEMREHMMIGRVERPGAPFGVIALHPRSPRNRQRWVEGNLSVDAAAEVAKRLRSGGLPVVLIADLNSTPSGTRCLELGSKAGLLRGKPLFLPVGTYPESWPLGMNVRTAPSIRAVWPTTLAIDDVWIDPSIRVTGWSRLEALTSEHRPIVVDLVIPGVRPADK